MPRSHLYGFFGPLFFGFLVAVVALMSLGVPMAILLAMFGTDPFTAFAYVLMTDKGTLAGVTGAFGVTLAMWLAHLVNRRMAWLAWLGCGVAGYALGALAIWTFVPQMTPAT
jgi:hypothetical protein